MRKEINLEKIKAFGRRLAALRNKKNMTQEELAFKANLSLSQIARIETGVINTSLNTIFIISDALGIDAKALFED